MKKSKKMPCRVFSVVMAFLLITLSVPFAFAADTVVLTESNVAVWPTIEGEIYYGQKLSDGLTVSGGTVTTDGTANGTVITGKFEFIDSEYVPNTLTTRADLKFIPDNDSYSGFEVTSTPNVIYSLNMTTPVLVDENSPPIATPVEEAGKRLNTSTISGGAVKNPYTGEILECEWYWVSKRTKVEEGGYFPAECGVNGGLYNVLTMDVYVGIVGDAVETTITEMPTIPETTFAPGLRWQDISLVGGKAVALGTETEIAGTFSHSMRGEVTGGTHTLDVTFTPNDITTAKSSACQITVTINKAPIKFVDENGNEIVPEITVEYGTKFNDISRLLLPYVKGADYTYLAMGDLEYKQCEEGTYTITASAPSDSENYEATELTFKIVIAKKKINPSLKALPGKMYIEDNSGVYKPKGTFTIEYTIDGVEQTPITGIQYNTHFEWNPTKSGNYEYTVIYNEAEENEYFIIDDFTTSNPIKLLWSFSATGSVDGEYTYGDEVTLEAPATDPAKADKPYYGFVEWVDANGNTGLSEEELENREITFTMPDGAVDLDATYRFDLLLCIKYYIQIVVDFFTSFFQSIGTLFKSCQ